MKFIGVIDQKLYAIEADSHMELYNALKQGDHSFIFFPMSDVGTCDILQLKDGRLSVKERLPEASTHKQSEPIDGTYRLFRLTYSIHKKDGEKILKASYNFKVEKKWIWTSLYLCFDREGYPRDRAYEWLQQRTTQEIVDEIFCTEDAIKNKHFFQKPISIRIETNESGFPIVVEEFW